MGCRMAFEDMKRFSYLVQCNKCGMWSGYVSKRRKKRPDKINTICSACHHRLRHTFGTMVGKSNTRYRPGRGAHNKSCSVAQIRPFPVASKCKSEAGKMNQKLKLQNAERSIHRRDTWFRKAKDVKTGSRFRNLK